MCYLLSSISKENEVSVEQFLKLKEIDSLSRMRINNLKLKSEQEDRVSKLNNRRQEALLRTAKLKQDLISTNDKMADVEKKLKTSSEQKQRLMDIGGDENKIAGFSAEIASLEEQGFDFLSMVEQIEKELDEEKTFISGLEKTIQEIVQETSQEMETLDHEIKNINFRINLLQDELPPDFKATLLKVSAKNLAHGPFTRIEQGSCYFCRFKISRIDESEIDMQKTLKLCPQCGRIFLPLGS